MVGDLGVGHRNLRSNFVVIDYGVKGQLCKGGYPLHGDGIVEVCFWPPERHRVRTGNSIPKETSRL